MSDRGWFGVVHMVHAASDLQKHSAQSAQVKDAAAKVAAVPKASHTQPSPGPAPKSSSVSKGR